MLVLHAAFLDDSLAVWAEPDADKTALISAVAELGLTLKFGKRIAKSATAWLPSLDSKAAPSTALFGDAPADGSYEIAAHKIAVLPLSARHAIEFVAACVGRRMVSPGLLIGEDLAYWTSALRFAAELVTRGQFLPALALVDGTYSARWLPVYDSSRLHALTQAMPPAARALTWTGVETAPETPAETVLMAFVQSMVDTLVCDAAGTRPREVESLHDQWLNALTADAALQGSEKELAEFARQVEEWQRPIQASARVPFRLCLRLQEPIPTDDSWQVEYLLQGRKDPSLHLPAQDVWQTKTESFAELSHDSSELREHLLLSLGQAAGISPAGSEQPEAECSRRLRAGRGGRSSVSSRDRAGARAKRLRRDVALVVDAPRHSAAAQSACQREKPDERQRRNESGDAAEFQLGTGAGR